MTLLKMLLKLTEDKFEFSFSHREGFKDNDKCENVLCLKITEKYTQLSISTEYNVDDKLEQTLIKSMSELCDKLREFVLDYEEKKDKKGLIKTAWELRK